MMFRAYRFMIPKDLVLLAVGTLRGLSQRLTC